MLLEAAVAAQGCHVGNRYLCVLDAAVDGWDIYIVLWQTVNCFEASFVRPSEDTDATVTTTYKKACFHSKHSINIH
jgi:hypothetical protein